MVKPVGSGVTPVITIVVSPPVYKNCLQVPPSSNTQTYIVPEVKNLVAAQVGVPCLVMVFVVAEAKVVIPPDHSKIFAVPSTISRVSNFSVVFQNSAKRKRAV